MLEGLTALDLTGGGAQLAGRLLADLGMRVIQVEPPEGDPTRRRGPFAAGEPHPEGSLRFAFLAAGKESLVAGADELVELVPRVDVLLESGPPGELDVAALRAHAPRLVVASITGFGRSGPKAAWRFADIVGQAEGGLLGISGAPDLPPVAGPGEPALAFASVAAALGVLAALRRRGRTGRGDHVDVSVQEAVATQEQLIREFLHGGVTIRREGSQHKHVAPGRIFRCRDGHVFLFVSSIHWTRFLGLWDGHPARFDEAEWATPAFRRTHADDLNAEVERWTACFDREELTSHLQENGIPCLPVNAPEEFLADPQVAGRGLFAAVDHPVLGKHEAPCFPALVDGRRPPARPAPLLGAHRPLPDADLPVTAAGRAGAPLEGIRVLSLTTGIAGPNAARTLANLGAEVIKVESRAGGLDAFRFFGSGVEGSPRFVEANIGVRSVTLNLKDARGLELFRRLVAVSDVVVENFRPDVLPRLGLGPDELRTIRPDLVVARMPGLGADGPRALYGTWGPTLAAFSGLTALWNHPGQPEPVGSQGVYADYLAGLLVPLAVTAALLRRERTGEGATLELAQMEGVTAVLGTAFLDVAVNGARPVPRGNADPERSLHGCFPCAGDDRAGEDRWCAIVCEDEADWLRLCAVLGVPTAAADRDLAVAIQTFGEEPFALVERLQAAGIAAGVVQTGADLAEDPHLADRGFVHTVAHPTLGEVAVAGLPLGFADAPTVPYRCPPPLGADNEDVLCGLLGLGREELAALEEDEAVY